MKDNLFEMLLNLFETSLSQLRKSDNSADIDAAEIDEDENSVAEDEVLHVKTQHHKSVRVITCDEQLKLTKASYQFLMRMRLCHVLSPDSFETVMNQLQSSDSRIVTLQETKWVIRTLLSSTLQEEQAAFLDLLIYQSEYEFIAH